ncbi:branched-chain alpha-keto acid dehydrogenase subunit E2 [Lysinibacillus sp. 2017]|uniref:dihydrolipoamide acetyltransferase family protein n=1 Tax=unclassified Lysinibacillus TaxID=2636778 RepID=UPI000D52634E|nr:MULTISPECIES: dihydrolipoamide acetyltransferase family protein [unclassified Lysinibacillus]AWE07874.1 branched-chain alpha-keto acid dehydrogenase subunit E2 [Lysinibacillus sp. 2017]TGN31839.1 2-oxo acid dehydrogenase subunit E2 [Lysinibacillus sp. S2017]
MTIQNILMPQLGESVTEGKIDHWLVKVGDKVNKYDPLAEVTTDKVNAEIPSSFTGVISELIATEGETLPVGAVVCTIEIEGAEMPPAPAPKSSNVSSAILNAGIQKKEPEAKAAPVEKPARPERKGGRYSPAVLMLANENDVDLSQIVGTGMDNRITRKDVEAYIAAGKPTSQAISHDEQPIPVLEDSPIKEAAEQKPHTKQAQEQVVTANGDIEIPVTQVRKAIAKNMLRSTHEIPHAWMMMEVDVTELVEYRDGIKNEFKQKEGFNLTYFAFFLKAVAQALKEFPMINSVWADDKIIQKKDINLSIAVATEDALFVPVIKNVDEKSIKGIGKEIHELSTIVRNGKLKLDHMQGGTFTVNNTGSFGSVQSMGIINYPQAAILQVESIVKRPVIVQGNMIAPRHMVNLCLSLDHRILDGLICGKFLSRVKEILENVDKQKMSVY